MSTQALVQMMAVAQVSMDLWRAEELAANARAAYHRDIEAYEAEHGRSLKRLRRDTPEHAGVRAFTADKYRKYGIARRKVYTIKCRLAKACAKLARINAERVS